MENEFLYQEETYKIRGACFKIWKEFGGAFKESIIDKALTEELRKHGFSIEDQKRIDIYYEKKKVGTYIPDKIINNIILLEIKCKPYITQGDKRQFWYYLKASSYKIGLLINFGSEKLEIHRRVYDKAREKYQRTST